MVSDFNNKSNIKSNRTTAISQKNYDFLEKLNIFKFSKKEFWPCQEMKLYTKNNEEKFVEIFDIKKNEKNNKRILYMINNNILIKNMLREINNCSSIKLTTNKIDKESKYGDNIHILDTCFNDRFLFDGSIFNNYNIQP